MDKIIINAADPEECRVAMLDSEGRLQEYYSDSSLKQLSLSNIYKGVIQNIEPGLQACFVNYGYERNGFLQLADIHPEYFLEESCGRHPDIRRCLRKGQNILVQVMREPSQIKGAGLTTYVSLAGRFIVLTPGRENVGISRRIESDRERVRLRTISDSLPVPDGLSYIVRTVAQDRTKKELAEDLFQVHNLWEDIRRRAQEAPAPSLIYREQDLAIKILRDHYTSDVKEILVDDQATFAKVVEYIKDIAPGQQKIVKYHKEKRPIFARHQLEDQLATIFQNQVKLKSGGSIVITPTEALVSIDVNSGKGTKEDNLEDTAYTTNLEAADEVARQLRLRDLGGLVVVDFIDMREERHRREIEKRIREATKVDKAKTDFSSISKFGLLELTRQRLRPSIETGSHITCPHCQGRGLVKTSEAASLGFLRQAAHMMSKGGFGSLLVKLNPDVAHYLLNYKRLDISRLEERYEARLILTGDPALPPGQFDMEPVRRSQETEPLKPGHVARGIYEDELGHEAFDPDEVERRPSAPHFQSNGFDKGGNGRPIHNSHNSHNNHNNDNRPPHNHESKANSHDSKFNRSRRSNRRGRSDYAKNSDSDYDAALAF
ncbi:MAG: Rne/Rng family ribonuclease [Deltaproteobacteria bacterium]|nr:Rne/Rng family ribonuclease [Deltaproteobacteria bacterium]